jgi:hypothetical protein
MKNDGGPAFPVQDAATWQGHGMTLRDYFAAHAAPQVLAMLASGEHTPSPGQTRAEAIGKAAYDIADALLKARAA